MKRINKIVLMIFTWLLIVTPVYAKQPTTCDRETMDNLGVHKKWEITDTNRENVKKAPCVDSKDKIYDFSEVLTDEEYEKLRQQLLEYIQKTKMDAIIVIADIPYSWDGTNEDYAADFYDYNDFGIEFDKYSGTMLLRNTYEADPYYDIYTFGNAQLYYDYDRLQIALDAVYDDLHNERYYDGFSKYISFLSEYYEKGVGLKNYIVDDQGMLSLVNIVRNNLYHHDNPSKKK